MDGLQTLLLSYTLLNVNNHERGHMLESLTDVLQPWALCFSMAAQLYIMLAE
jgi:hypothetical protein